MRLVWLAGLSLGMCVAISAQAPETKTETEIKAEAAQALALYDKGNMVAAVPLYEDLHAQRPQSSEFTERLAMTLVSKAAQQSDTEGRATRQRARKLLLEAKAGGDNSNLIQIMLEKLQDSAVPAATAPPPPGHEWIQKGEMAFTGGDLQAALGFYEKAFEVNPQYYVAALFAGDTEYKLHHPAEAGKWFAKAIAINPNVETAHRYWGDCLDKAGEHQKAESEFIEAIIAEPYTRTPRVGLKQWAGDNHARILAPQAQLPAEPAEGKDGHINITIAMPDKGGEDPTTGAALAYSMQATVWQLKEFKKNYPNEKVYRHSLPEEAASIRAMLEVKIPDEKLTPSLKTLTMLEKDGMLECWILLDNPDQGVAQDYVAYRAEHRELMHKYIEKYDVHPM